MLNPLLDKFDKDFDELIVFQTYEIPQIIKDDTKLLAHSHLEEAYRAGKEEGVILGQLKPLEKANEKAKEVIENIYQQGFKAAHQSNLERLIEACGDRFEALVRVSDIQWNALFVGEFPDGSDGRIGSTPTEAVENLIKALNK